MSKLDDFIFGKPVDLRALAEDLHAATERMGKPRPGAARRQDPARFIRVASSSLVQYALDDAYSPSLLRGARLVLADSDRLEVRRAARHLSEEERALLQLLVDGWAGSVGAQRRAEFEALTIALVWE